MTSSKKELIKNPYHGKNEESVDFWKKTIEEMEEADYFPENATFTFNIKKKKKLKDWIFSLKSTEQKSFTVPGAYRLKFFSKGEIINGQPLHSATCDIFAQEKNFSEFLRIKPMKENYFYLSMVFFHNESGHRHALKVPPGNVLSVLFYEDITK